MATLSFSSSSSLHLFTTPSSKLIIPSTPSLSFPPSHSLSSSLSISLSSLFFGPSRNNNGSRCISSFTSFSVKASAKKNVLIVNTNAGGHAVIGFYFAKQLLGSGHQVSIMIVGEESSDKMKKPPFSRFSEIVSAGGKTVWGNPSDIGKVLEGSSFDVVLDNNGKDLDDVRPMADWAKSSGAKQFLFISSAGIYKPADELPHVEGDAINEAGHFGVETYMSANL